MIILKMGGGLGNQMFHYANGFAFSIKHNMELGIDMRHFKNRYRRPFLLHKYNIPNLVVPTNILKKMESDRKNFKYIKRAERHFSPIIIDSKKNNYLDGYWPTDEYFRDIEKSKLLEKFSLLEPLESENLDLEHHIKSTVAISIHIRRGDYLRRKELQTCSFSYYRSAANVLAKLEANPTFFIFSNDSEWTKKNIQIPFPTVYIDHNGDRKSYIDMYLMSLCKHNIVANSSFSWWGAWLNQNNQKIIIYPKEFKKDSIRDPITKNHLHDPKKRIPREWVQCLKELNIEVQ